MIDWLSAYVGYDASNLVLGRFVELAPGGECIRDRDRWETARGSWESGVQITRAGPTSDMLQASREHGFLCSENSILKLSGNPSKFLQGHNVAGPSVSQLGAVVQAMVRAFGEGFRPLDADDERLPALQRSRVDVTTSVELDSHEAVHDWLKLAASMTRSRHGRAVDSSGTVYWGKNSRRWSLKAYCKHCELKVHPPVVVRELLADLLDWTRQHLRLELTLRRPELKVHGGLDERIIWDYAHRLEVPTMKAVAKLSEADLRPAQRGALQLWADGRDLTRYYSRATLYRHRRAILDQVGVDVTMDAQAQLTAADTVLLSIDELQRREVLQVPDRIQRSLFGAA